MSIKYTCRGPHVLAGDAAKTVEGKIASLKARLKEVDDAETAAPLRKKMTERQDELRRLSKLPKDTSIGRAGCGHDITKQIAAVPDDGEVYEYECAKCGNTGTVRKAVPEEPATAAD